VLARGTRRGAHAFALRQGVSSDASISLLVASLDLALVRSITDAMRAADIASGRGQPASGLGPAPTLIERRFRIEPEPEILPRERIEPEPRIEPRQVIRPADRYEPRDQRDLIPVPAECYKPCKKHTLEAPWQVLPWEQPLPCRVEPKLKVVVKPPDIVHKGSLIDFFI
jgi:hypothetical protein